MSSLTIASVMFGSVFVSTLGAMLLARLLPKHHFSDDSKEVVKLGLGVIGTLTALVLGLLVTATKGTFDAQSATVKDLAGQLAVLDRVLAGYGPEAEEARKHLRGFLQAVLGQFWPHEVSAPVGSAEHPSRTAGLILLEAITALDPKTEVQRLLKGRGQDMIIGLAQTRQRLVVTDEDSIPVALLVVLGCWQAVLFAGFGLLAPRNGTAFTVLIVCALSVAGALFVVLELDRPFDGMIRVSNEPLRAVLAHMGE